MNRRCVVIKDNKEYGTEFLPFPPVGTLGTTISELDDYGDFDVMFDNYPCPNNNPDESWVTHWNMIAFLSDDEIEQEEVLAQEDNHER